MTGRKLIIYMRPDCHLCDQAVTLLRTMNIPHSTEDIETVPELERKYGLLIPVLFAPDTGEELCFPFSEDEVRRFI